jgi:hypothetical protein
MTRHLEPAPRPWRKVCLAVGLLLSVPAGGQISEGATRKEVIDRLGWPRSISATETRELFDYSDYVVLLENGRVVHLRWKPVEERAPARKSPSRTPATPPGSSPNASGVGSMRSAPGTPSPQTAPSRRTPAPATMQAPSRAVGPYPGTGSAPSRIPPQPAFAPAPVAGPGANPVAPEPTPPPPRQDAILRYRSTNPPPPANPFRFAYLLLGIGVGLPLLATIVKLLLKRRGRSPRPDIADPWASRPVDPLKDGWSLELLKEIEWHGFEKLVCAYHQALGSRASLTGFGADGGVDVEVFAADSASPTLLIQCKAFGSEPVGVKLVRELHGVAAARGGTKTAFYTTSDFSPDARTFAQQVGMELVNGAEFIARLHALPLSASLRLLEDATRGDYTVPTCVACGVKMVLRNADGGRIAGSAFWGCANYPSCRQTLRVRRVR